MRHKFKITREHYLEIKQLLACGWFFDPPEPMVPNYKTITDIFNGKYRIPYGLSPLPRNLINKQYSIYDNKESLKRSLRNLIPARIGKLKASLFKIFLACSNKSPSRFKYQIENVSPVRVETVPQFNVQNYVEMKQIRNILDRFADRKFQRVADIGCGYGRLIMLLSEYAKEVYGFEREKHLVDIGKTLLPGIKFIQTETLSQLDLEDNYLDFAMTVAVLQHINDEDVQAILKEVKRVVGKGYVLLSEKTDPSDCYGNINSKNEFFSLGRSPEKYEEWMRPFKLIHIEDRELVPTYFRKRAFSVMLFENL